MAAPTPIAFCITDLDPGGAERALVQIVRRLDREAWSPVVYCLGPRGALADELEQLAIPCRCLGATSPAHLGVVWKLRSLLAAQRPALLQTFLFHANIAGRVAARLAGVPVVIAGIRVAERERRSHLIVERLSRRLVTRYICVSRSVAKFAIAECRLSPGRVTVIPNGVDADRFSQAAPADLSEFHIPAGAPVLLFVGRLHAQKGVVILLEAAKNLMRERPDLYLLMVGQGPLKPVAQRMVEQAGLSSRIRFAGARRDVDRLMRAATALVLPSLWEGLPNVVLEAMAAGLPVVATTVDGTEELIEEDRTGWTAQPGDRESLQRAIAKCLDCERALGDAVTHRSQVIVQESFTWDLCAASHAALYRELSAG